MATSNEQAAYILVPHDGTYLRMRMADGYTHILVRIDTDKLEWQPVKEPEQDWEALEARQERFRVQHRNDVFHGGQS